MKPSFARSSVAALAVLVAGGCGSAASTHPSARPSTPKLSLAKASAKVGAADAALPRGMPVRLTKYVLDGTLPDLGTKALVYRWTAHAVDIAEVNRLAQALGIGAPATATSDGFTASDSDATLTVTTSYGTTQISYYPGGNAVDGSGGGSTGSSSLPSLPTQPGTVEVPLKLTAPVDVPSANAAEGIARALLDRMGVLDGAQWDSKVSDSGGIAVTCAVGENCTGVPQQVTARDVSFSLVVDGIHVTGVGWNVTVGERSIIQSVYGEWGSAVVLGTYDLRSTADAFAALQKGDANFGGREPVAVDTPVKAQAELNPSVIGPLPPVSVPPVSIPAGSVPPVSSPAGSEPSVSQPAVPIDVHVTGVSLGIARWSAVDGNENVVDLVPTYVFHTTLDGVTSDVEELALDPAAINFADPIGVPVPQPGKLTPEPAPAPDSRAPASGATKATGS